MTKDDAIRLLNCTGPGQLADVLGLTPGAISQWPQNLPRHAEDRVLAELWRRKEAQRDARV